MTSLQSTLNEIARPWFDSEMTEQRPSGSSMARNSATSVDEHRWTLSLGAADLLPEETTPHRPPPPFMFAEGDGS